MPRSQNTAFLFGSYLHFCGVFTRIFLYMVQPNTKKFQTNLFDPVPQGFIIRSSQSDVVWSPTYFLCVEVTYYWRFNRCVPPTERTLFGWQGLQKDSCLTGPHTFISNWATLIECKIILNRLLFDSAFSKVLIWTKHKQFILRLQNTFKWILNKYKSFFLFYIVSTFIVKICTLHRMSEDQEICFVIVAFLTQRCLLFWNLS